MSRKDIQIMQQIARDPVERGEFNKHFRTITLTTLDDFIDNSKSTDDILNRVNILCKTTDVAFLLLSSVGVVLVTTEQTSWSTTPGTDWIVRSSRSTLAYIQKLFFDAVGPGANHAKNAPNVTGSIVTLDQFLGHRHQRRSMS